MNNRERKLKEARRQNRLTDKMIYDAATMAMHHSFIVAAEAAINVFGDRASNPKMEKFFKELLYIWECIGKHEVKIETLSESIESRVGIKYDLTNGTLYNLRRKVK